jgi:hypothetical protein
VTRILARALPWNAKPAKTAEKILLCVLCVLCALGVLCSACAGATSLFRQYEYEEEIYLSLDGTATVYVNSSLAGPAARFDAAAVREYFTTPQTRVGRVSQSRRSNRRFAHVRLDVTDIRRLAEAAPFAWSTYQFQQRDNLFVYLQHVGASAGKNPGATGWTGRELVAFRLHLPSKIRYHNTLGIESRGNILAWEQPLSDRLRGEPLQIEARMDTQSILYTTLWLFGVTFVIVVAAFTGVIWWVMRRGTEAPVEPAR